MLASGPLLASIVILFFCMLSEIHFLDKGIQREREFCNLLEGKFNFFFIQKQNLFKKKKKNLH